MLTDSQLVTMCKKMQIPLAGIFFKDELPSKLEFNKGYIINISDGEDKEGNENDGTHWTALFVKKYPNNEIEPIYFDSYGALPPEDVKQFVRKHCSKFLPNTTKDIQSLVNNACGYYCCAFLYAVTHPRMASGELYADVDQFLQMFDDLNTSTNYKKNEYILKHFFRSSDAAIRVPVSIEEEAHAKGFDNGLKIPVDVRMI